MKLLITGGAGFIGSEFVRKAVELGHDIAVVDALTYAGDLIRLKSVENNIEFYNVDICDTYSVYKIFEKEKPECVVHWAAESHVDRSIIDASPFINTNVRGTQILLDISRKFNIQKFINIATDEVYGELGKEGSFYETTPLAPNSPYSVSKTSADMLGTAYFRTYGLPVITVRPSNNYGHFQYPEKLIPVIFLKAWKNEKVPVYGEGLNIREWLYVEDCVNAVFKLIESGFPGEAYNIGSGCEKTNIDVVKSVLDLLGKPHSLIEYVKDRPGHDFRYSLNTDKINKLTGWKAEIDFETGIEKTIKWYRDNINWTMNKLSHLQNLWQKQYEK